MSIEVLASDVAAEFGCDDEDIVCVTAAKKSGGFTSLKQLQGTLKSKAHKEYAAAYYKWVSGGRKGAAPTDDDSEPRTWKYIRSGVNALLAKGK